MTGSTCGQLEEESQDWHHRQAAGGFLGLVPQVGRWENSKAGTTSGQLEEYQGWNHRWAAGGFPGPSQFSTLVAIGKELCAVAGSSVEVSSYCCSNASTDSVGPLTWLQITLSGWNGTYCSQKNIFSILRDHSGLK